MRFLARVPLESAKPAAWFGALRLAVAVTAFAAELIFNVPHRDRLLALTAGAVVWSLFVWAGTRVHNSLALAPLVALGDLAILAVGEALVPEIYPVTRFLAIVMIAAHAHIQGEARGVALGALTCAVLIPIAFAVDTPVPNGLLGFYETVFAAAALSTGSLVGRLRAAESTGRLRARQLSRRMLEGEADVRRRVAEALHDGPVQELVSMDLMLTTARQLIQNGENKRAADLLDEARGLTERNIAALRDEIVSLGPYGLDQLTLDAAIEECAPAWSKRYGVEIDLALERFDMPNEICGGMFGIAQEAVANAGRHARANRIWIDVRKLGSEIELRVRDDGAGFNGEVPLGAHEPGHIGLASMRERAELMDGSLKIETGPGGSAVIVRIPAPPQGSLADNGPEGVSRSRSTPG